MHTKTISLREEDQNVAQEVDQADLVSMALGHQNTEDEELDQEINEEINEADKELEEGTPVEESVVNQDQGNEDVISDVVNDAENVPQSEILAEASQVSSDFESIFNDQGSNVLGNESTLSSTLDDSSDKEIEKSGNIDFSSNVVSHVSEQPEEASEVSNDEDLDEVEEKEEQSQTEELLEFGGEGEGSENEQNENEFSDEETAAEKTKEELENADESAEEYEQEIAEGLGEKKKVTFDDIFNDAMEEAIKTDPKAESVVVIAYDKEQKKPEIKNINVEKFRKGTFKNSNNPENQNAEDLLTDSIAVPVETDKTVEEQKHLLHEKIEELEEAEIRGHLEDEKENLLKPKGMPDLTKPFSGSAAFEEFNHLNFEQELVKQQEEIANAMSGNEKKDGDHSQYLENQEQAKKALKLFAESDAMKRAGQLIPRGIPDQIFLSDLMGVSGNGDYEPSANMIKYYGMKSGFQGHFANRAKSQISFADIDTLTGLLSDLNGVFTTIFNLLPSKKEAESEKDEDYEVEHKNNFEKAYDILKFYSRVRGFVHTLVYNRHLIVQDIQFLKDKVQSLNSSQEDMLRFYGIEIEYARMKVRSSKYTTDMKIKKSLSNIHGISYNFSQDVKIALKALFTLEKSIVFFDTDVRSLANSINTTNPYEAIKTVDNVILFITRLFEVKVDLFESIVEMKDALVNLKKYREAVTKEIRNCDKLANYYDLVGMGVSIPGIKGIITLFALLIFACDFF
jgi:hypothetical protein